MSKPIFDFDDNNTIIQTSNDNGFNTNGDFMIKLGDNLAVNTRSGQTHLVSGWKNIFDDDED